MNRENLYTDVRLGSFTEYLDSIAPPSHTQISELADYLWHHHIFAETLEDYEQAIPSHLRSTLEIVWPAYKAALHSYNASKAQGAAYLNWATQNRLTKFGTVSINLCTGEKQENFLDVPQNGSFKERSSIALLQTIQSLPEYGSLTIHTPSHFLANTSIRMNAAQCEGDVIHRVWNEASMDVARVWWNIAAEMKRRDIRVKYGQGGFNLRGAKEVAKRGYKKGL